MGPTSRIVALVPEAVWEKLMAQRDLYFKEQSASLCISGN